ncbi:hypothetical protein B296_00045399 [Ensete ventricosum]|uniref:Uncharacterized protein n=1 Tax=Ensete ventricosum TaxID=4639 RepID=A0A426X7L2_ENSVE|nr:hypothetical protein B296_00045399 [Ensete ventricosum]
MSLLLLRVDSRCVSVHPPIPVLVHALATAAQLVAMAETGTDAAVAATTIGKVVLCEQVTCDDGGGK